MNDYRGTLRESFASRARHNPRYSLRAFARDLGIAPSRLSDVLSGKRGLSRRNAEKVSAKLGLSQAERARFHDEVDSLHARSGVLRTVAKIKLERRDRDESYRTIQEDSFRAISDWYHLAILEAFELRGFRADPAWLGRVFGISEVEARLALERLERLGFLAKRLGKLRVTGRSHSVPGGAPSEAIRRFHTQVLERALAALVLQPVEERDFGAHVIAVSKERVPEIRARLRDLRRELARELDSDKRKDSVYCLSTQFFKLGET
jgi:uncharacterized protein (TIGR02147 family)